MIASVVACFKKRRVSSTVEFVVLVLIVKAPMVAFPLPQLPTLSIEDSVVGPSTQVVPKKFSSGMLFLTSLLVDLLIVSLP